MPRTPSKSRSSSHPILQTPPHATSPATNEKGELTGWNSNSDDGKLFKSLYEANRFKDWTASQIRKEYATNFGKYANQTINSALQNLRKTTKRDIDTRQSKGSQCELTKQFILFCIFILLTY
jgi:hypothetical protein